MKKIYNPKLKLWRTKVGWSPYEYLAVEFPLETKFSEITLFLFGDEIWI